MLRLEGIARNFDESLMGRISFSEVKKNERPSTIIVNPDLNSDLKDYLAVLSDVDNENFKNRKIPLIVALKEIEKLSEGDIVEIFPHGSINVLYQIKSKHNIIFVTSRCNSNCIMCPQPIEKEEGDLMALNLKLISLIDKSTSELALTGGEPTVIGKDLFHLILACKHFLPNTSLLLLTNARKFSDFEYTHFFSSLGHPDITVGVALYGDNDIEHDFIVGSKGAFNETIRGIINLASFNNPVEIRTVIHKYTYRRLLRISEFIYRNMPFVKHVAFMGLEFLWEARNNFDSLWVEPEKIISPLEEAVYFLAKRGITVSIYNIPLCMLSKRLWTFARQSISEWKNCFALICDTCTLKDECSEIFDSGVDIYKNYLKPFN